MQQTYDLFSKSLDRMESDIDLFQERLDYLSSKRDRLKDEVEQLMDILHDVLKQKKEELLNKLDELYTTEREKLRADIKDKQTLVAESKDRLKKMRELMRSSPEVEVVERGRLLEQKNIQPQLTYDESEPRLMDLNLNVELDALMDAVGRLPFGDVDAVYDDRGVTVLKRFVNSSASATSQSTSTTPSSSPSPSSVLSYCEYEETFTSSAVLTNVIIARVEEDQTKPKLNDIAVVEVGEITAVVVTDRSNKCIKSFYKRGDVPFYSTQSESTKPRGIARIGSGIVGVTLPGGNLIKIFKVTPVLIRYKNIKTTKAYRGIAMLDSERLIVSTNETFPGTIDVLDYNGNVLNSITTDKNGENLFDSPIHLCTTHQRDIIVSDCERKSITCMTVTGNIIFRYGEGGEVTVKYPLGVAMDAYGDILVADCDNHKVVKVRGDGQGVKDFLGKEDGISGPYSVDIDSYGIVYVAEWNGNIKVFDTSLRRVVLREST